ERTSDYAADEAVAFLVSQDHPYKKAKAPIKMGRWHRLQLEIKDLNNGHSMVTWRIDGVEASHLELDYSVNAYQNSASEKGFYIYCSVESLPKYNPGTNQYGSTPPNRDVVANFDSVQYGQPTGTTSGAGLVLYGVDSSTDSLYTIDPASG